MEHEVIERHEKVAIYDGNEFVCGTCPVNSYGERIAWDLAHPVDLTQTIESFVERHGSLMADGDSFGLPYDTINDLVEHLSSMSDPASRNGE